MTSKLTRITMSVGVVSSAVATEVVALRLFGLAIETIEQTLFACTLLVTLTVLVEVVAGDALADGGAVLEGSRVEAAFATVVVARKRVALLLEKKRTNL